jgi:hypothetical protein
MSIEEGEAQSLVALQEQVTGASPQCREPATDPLSGRVAGRQGRASGEGFEERARCDRAAVQRRSSRLSEPRGKRAPVRRERPRGGVQLADRPVLGGVEAHPER